MKIYKKYYDNETKHNILEFLGIKIKTKNLMRDQIKTIHTILNAYLDISNYPQAKGLLREQQIQCLHLLNIVDNICKKRNLTYWLEGGTLLGAVRHKGFIPWDDDIDICMPRKDYDKILPILKKIFTEDNDFFVRERAISINFFQIRIRNKNKNIGLDIFPIDSYYKSKLKEKEKKEITKEIKHTYKIINKKFPNKNFTQEEIQNAKKIILQIRDEFIMKKNPIAAEKPALFYGIDFPYNNTKGDLIMTYDTIYPLNLLIFENKIFPVPNRTDLYLKNLYGDYMKFPEII